MAVVSVRKFPDPVLREKARQVADADNDIDTLIKNLADTMYNEPGIGLAANQVGVLKRVMVLDLGEELEAFINPEIVWVSKEKETDAEGCLSLSRDEQIQVPRHAKIRVKAINSEGKTVEFEAQGMLARAIQHEIDHLDGVLIIDRTTEEDRKELLSKIMGPPMS